MTEFNFNIERSLAVLKSNHEGNVKELNLVSWNGFPAKLDIRDWSPNHSYCFKGLTFTEEEGRKLLEALGNYFAELDAKKEDEFDFPDPENVPF